MIKKVPQLKTGSTIAIVSPSWGGPGSFPLVYKIGIDNLKKHFGFKIKELPTTKKSADFNYNNPQKRAEDIVAAFKDKDVDGIICSIGGDDSLRLLKYLDKYNFSPKFFMGYSDSTVLLNYFYNKGFITFHGPSVMAGFAEPGDLNKEFIDYIDTFLFNRWKSHKYKPFSSWTEENMNWLDIKSFEQKRKYKKNKDWELLKKMKKQNIEGEVWGGSLEALEFIKGTKYWPSTKNFWKNKILMLEISDEKISAAQFKYILRNYGLQGVFQDAKAILFGRFANMSKNEIEEYKKIINNVIYKEFESNIPIILNLDFGHTYSQQIFPIGVKMNISIDKFISISINSPFIYEK